MIAVNGRKDFEKLLQNNTNPMATTTPNNMPPILIPSAVCPPVASNNLSKAKKLATEKRTSNIYINLFIAV